MARGRRPLVAALSAAGVFVGAAVLAETARTASAALAAGERA